MIGQCYMVPIDALQLFVGAYVRQTKPHLNKKQFMQASNEIIKKFQLLDIRRKATPSLSPN